MNYTMRSALIQRHIYLISMYGVHDKWYVKMIVVWVKHPPSPNCPF